MRFEIIVSLFATMIISAILTPFVRRISFKVGAIDKPTARRVNKVPMPTMGGLAIFIAFNFSLFFLLRNQIPNPQFYGIFFGECIILVTGIIDDIFELRPIQKMIGILLAALAVYLFANVRMTTLTFPFIGIVNFGWFSLPITLLWIAAITNAINLLDGLDGLATGVTIIALFTTGFTGLFFLPSTNIYIVIMIFTLVAAEIGFLPYNFFPARIYLGDTGALFIGFMISIFSLSGLKNATFITILIPVMILGVPLTDTVYAILRRLLNKESISHADKRHLHHRLMQMGLTHRQTVLVIYGISLIFSFIALLYPVSTLWGSVLLTIGILIGIEIFVEAIGLVGENRTPMLNWIRKLVRSNTSKVDSNEFKEENTLKDKVRTRSERHKK
ncbi:MraY family glycosyltransferase [Pediococcus pentosaceus]|jgi:UDP-N-acetylmuramyl pentapeptide phosphotransferase/UDP-N-acetylglucosamine-1-phosphate transferase|uniref:MraY family glycosyltransferase n=3 Tax=Pediococcus pentosaceus TaxID=1255 RepID=A0A1Y0VQ48_PEDPE|nr:MULTISPECIES: MraY family glycosyltransferase [Pediococcus]ABJ67519.1 UDP-N-acetylmuramyl pentapeptide phosphotransferase/UDP-N-acetylglucosamine-1-phosphate transferase [Pediococcus pentosaceus ATCC 25745]AHA04661.1 UDP-phosphate N-acetyl-glucosaminyl transferase [Pediococcus pentosaceus SL4]ANI98325.1 undecaprenyl-phosphate alpha-N-acetylglucosaminyl 1-phosphate transferase [Pediococcus pentosaceus]ARW20285.1 UDP-N-acetylglucosamine--undecaprenyl-phosphateN-acetylglucosaminephosphotransfer